jgi:hypothetical protein
VSWLAELGMLQQYVDKQHTKLLVRQQEVSI